MQSNLQDALFNITEHQTNSDDHYTPKWVFDLLDVEFDIDVASPPGGVAYIKTKKYYTQAEDGLIQPWFGLVWCNPPYSNIAPWIDRLNNHRNGIALLPHTKGSWRREIWSKADGIVEWNTLTEIRFLHQGKEKTIFPTTFLAAWGEVALQAISRVGRVRT